MLYRPELSLERHAKVDEIVRVKRDYIMSRWIDERGMRGFNEWDPGFGGTKGLKTIHLGWTGCCAAPAVPSMAADCYWAGGTSSDWATSANWTTTARKPTNDGGARGSDTIGGVRVVE